MHSISQSTPARRLLSLAAIATTALVTGCAAVAPLAPEQAVQQRAQQYWQARIAQQPAKAYAFTTPSYRQLRSPEQFARQVGNVATVKDASVYNVRCEEERCTARMELKVHAIVAQVDAGLVSMYVDETWVKEAGQWWIHQSI